MSGVVGIPSPGKEERESLLVVGTDCRRGSWQGYCQFSVAEFGTRYRDGKKVIQ